MNCTPLDISFENSKWNFFYKHNYRPYLVQVRKWCNKVKWEMPTKMSTKTLHDRKKSK